MPRGNPAVKLAVTMDRDVHARVVRAATEEGVAVSRWLTAAAAKVLRIRDGLDAVDEWEQRHGPFTSDELEAARARVTAPPRRRARRR